jgi:hypothetical protein
MIEQKVLYLTDDRSSLLAGDSDPRYDPWAGSQRPSATDMLEGKYDEADFHRRMTDAHHILPRLVRDGWVVKSIHVVSNHRATSSFDGSQEREGGVVGYVLLERQIH